MVKDFDLRPWLATQEQIKKNKQPRINWKPLLNGNSLNRACYRFSVAGLDAEQTFRILKYEHPEFSQEMLRRLEIGINARFSELGTAKSELIKTQISQS